MELLFLSQNTIKIGQMILDFLVKFFKAFGFGSYADLLAKTTVAVGIVFLAWLANWIVKKWILVSLERFLKKTKTTWDDHLVRHRVFVKLSHLAPAMVINSSSSLLFKKGSFWFIVVERLSMVYMTLVAALVVHSLLNASVEILREIEGTKDKPLESYAQVIKIIVWLFATIIIVAELLGRSPWALLGGLGAFTAVLMLVFKDSILGFVASVQMTTLDLVHKGDWIEMPKYGADGTIIGFSLTTIKVQNWDKTITTIPTYALISDSFKNWRGMSQSGGRRIKRSLSIDITSIGFLSEDEIRKLRRIDILKSYLNRKTKEINRENRKNKINQNSLVNGRRLTNVGTFRAYCEAYLRSHPMIHQEGMTFLVRQLPPNAEGLPIQIYVFSKEQRWAQYEGIISDIFDHMLASLPEFGLRAFQYPTGNDITSFMQRLEK